MAGGNGGYCTHYFISPSEEYIIFQEIIIAHNQWPIQLNRWTSL